MGDDFQIRQDIEELYKRIFDSETGQLILTTKDEFEEFKRFIDTNFTDTTGVRGMIINEIISSIDSEIDANSVNAVQNRAVKGALDNLQSYLENLINEIVTGGASLVGYLKTEDIEDNLEYDDDDPKVLSAKQGTRLKGLVDGLDANKSDSTHGHGILHSDGTIGTSGYNSGMNVVTNNGGEIALENKPPIPTGFNTTAITEVSNITFSPLGANQSQHTHNAKIYELLNSKINETGWSANKNIATNRDGKIYQRDMFTVEYQGDVGTNYKYDKIVIDDNLTSTNKDHALSSNQGYVLKNYMDTQLATKLATTGLTASKLLGTDSSGDITYYDQYTHPSDHPTTFIIETSQLTNRYSTVSANSSQHTINEDIYDMVHNHSHGDIQVNGMIRLPVDGKLVAQTNKNVVTDNYGYVTTEDKPDIATVFTGSNDSSLATVGSIRDYVGGGGQGIHLTQYAQGIIFINNTFEDNVQTTILDYYTRGSETQSNNVQWFIEKATRKFLSVDTTLKGQYNYRFSVNRTFNKGDTLSGSIYVTDYTGNPVNNHTFTLKLPDGSTGSLTTNANGQSSNLSTLGYVFDRYGSHTLSVGSDTYTLEVKVDTGWVNITPNTGFKNFVGSGTTANQPLQYRKLGNQIWIRGAVQPTSSISTYSEGSVVVTTLPSSCRPTQRQISVQHGSNSYRFALMIETNGNVVIDRYSNDTSSRKTIPDTAWLNIYTTFLND